MATISGIDKGARLVPSSTQLRNALAYLAITVFALIFLNMYSATATRNLMFREKYTSSQDKLQVVTSSLSGVDMLSEENVRQVIAVLGELNVTRLIVTDASATALYDSSQSMNAEGRTVLFAEVTQALSGQDVFRCKYENGALQYEETIREKLHPREAICALLEKCGFRVLQCSDRLIPGAENHGTTWFIAADKGRTGGKFSDL